MPKIKVKDVNLNYESFGEGFPLIMILGLESNIDWWGRSLLRKISNHFRVIVFDNRGTGRSDAPDIKFTLKTLIEDTVGLMDALNIKQAHVFGHSMGGRIAQGVVLNYPKRVKKLIICSSSCGESKLIPASPEVMHIVRKPRENQSPEEAAKNMLSIFYTEEFLKKNPKIVEIAVQYMTKVKTSPKSYNQQLEAIATYDVCERLKKINTETCVMHGEKDQLVPPQNGEVLAKLIPNAKLVLFKNSAHVPFVEEREKFIKSLIDFFK